MPENRLLPRGFKRFAMAFSIWFTSPAWGKRSIRWRDAKLIALKSGPRSYTSEQEAFIEKVVRERQPLSGRPLPIEDDGP